MDTAHHHPPSCSGNELEAAGATALSSCLTALTNLQSINVSQDPPSHLPAVPLATSRAEREITAAAQQRVAPVRRSPARRQTVQFRVPARDPVVKTSFLLIITILGYQNHSINQVNCVGAWES